VIPKELLERVDKYSEELTDKGPNVRSAVIRRAVERFQKIGAKSKYEDHNAPGQLPKVKRPVLPITRKYCPKPVDIPPVFEYGKAANLYQDS